MIHSSFTLEVLEVECAALVEVDGTITDAIGMPKDLSLDIGSMILLFGFEVLV